MIRILTESAALFMKIPSGCARNHPRLLAPGSGPRSMADCRQRLRSRRGNGQGDARTCTIEPSRIPSASVPVRLTHGIRSRGGGAAPSGDVAAGHAAGLKSTTAAVQIRRDRLGRVDHHLLCLCGRSRRQRWTGAPANPPRRRCSFCSGIFIVLESSGCSGFPSQPNRGPLRDCLIKRIKSLMA